MTALLIVGAVIGLIVLGWYSLRCADRSFDESSDLLP